MHFRKVVVTGGAGFIGSHFVNRLRTECDEIVVFDNLSSGFESNIPEFVQFYKGDIRRAQDLETPMRGASAVFHFAEFIPNVEGHVIRFSSSNPKEDLDVSVAGTLNVLEEARKNDSHFILASSAAVYGSSAAPLAEIDSLAPISPYGVSKLCAEQYTLLYHRSYGLPVTIFRFFNVFGPRQRKYLMFDCLSKLKKDAKRIELLGTGKEKRDYVSIVDLIDEVLAVIQGSEKENLPIFNLGTGIGRTTTDVVKLIAELVGVQPELFFLGRMWRGTSDCLVADMTKTQRYFHRPTGDFRLSLGELVSWFRVQYGL